MVQYRRARAPGATYFFTVALHDRRLDLLVAHVDLLRAAFVRERRRLAFSIGAMVVLPDHLHSIWTLPQGDGDYSGRWRSIKSAFVRGLMHRGVATERNRKGESTIWQRRFWEHQIRNEDDYIHHVDYIHFNPVKHGLVERCAEWRWSSFHRFVRRGLLPRDWATDAVFAETFGE